VPGVRILLALPFHREGTKSFGPGRLRQILLAGIKADENGKSKFRGACYMEHIE
jgi:hypothetical protein